MVGGALQADFGVRLGCDAGKHGLAEAGFAEAGLTRQNKELAFSSDGHRPTVQHEREFGVPADKGG